MSTITVTGFTTTVPTFSMLQTARAQLVAAKADADQCAADLRDLINDKATSRFDGALAIAMAKVELRQAAKWVRTCEGEVRRLGGRV